MTAKLIAEHGYAGTSIRMIASAADTSPASIFNLFENKDSLLNELIAFMAGSSFDFYARLETLELSPEVALYLSVREETRAIASAAPAFPAIFYLPELNQPGFARAQQIRADMVAHYRRLISNGTNSGVFACALPELAAEQVFQLTETVILARATTRAFSHAQLAESAAQFALRGLLVDSEVLAEIEQIAAGIDLQFTPPAAI
ncbi:MAG: TetR/AcrR family transcriptional regulator [Pseudomonadota bacterium]